MRPHYVVLYFLLLLSCPIREHDPQDQKDFLPEFVFEEAGIHPSRCAYEDCICTVTIPKYDPVFKNVKTTSGQSAFFGENESRLSVGEIQKVKSFVLKNMNAKSILVVGYTDGCGSYDDNKILSSNRARTAYRVVRNLGFKNKIIMSGMSELTSTHEANARRVDILSSDNFTLEVAPPNLTADHYLLDASGSSKNYAAWVNIIAANRKPRSRLHISYTRKCSNGTNALNINPSGATEIWYSYWQVLDKMSSGQTLIILSDFDSRYPLSFNDSLSLQNKVRSKGVKIYAVRL